jgi:hypothetical protein
MKSTCHFSTEVGSVRIEPRESFLTFSQWSNNSSFLMERHPKLKSEIKIWIFQYGYPQSLNNLAADWLQPYTVHL